MTTLQEVDTRLIVVETKLESLATKTDLSEMNERFSARISALEARMEARMDSFATKADLAELETRLVKWLVGVLIGSTVAASSIAVLVQTLIG